MASNGLLKKAFRGKCRMCHRVRSTSTQVHPVGEVRMGYATGYIWECNDVEDCNKSVEAKLQKYHPESLIALQIKRAVEVGRYKEWTIKT